MRVGQQFPVKVFPLEQKMTIYLTISQISILYFKMKKADVQQARQRLNMFSGGEGIAATAGAVLTQHERFEHDRMDL